MLMSEKCTKRAVSTGLLVITVFSYAVSLHAFCNDRNIRYVEAAVHRTSMSKYKFPINSYQLKYNSPVVTLKQESIKKEKVIVTPSPTPTPKPTQIPKELASNGKEYIYYGVYDDSDNKSHFLSEALQKYTYDLCIKYNVENYYTLILAQLYHESKYNANAISKTNDYGIAQINICNHKWLREKLNITNFLNPYQSILCNIYMMNEYLKKFGAKKALVCYNSGSPDSTNPYSLKYSEEIISMWNNDIRKK